MTYSNGGRILQRTETGPAANGTSTTASYDINNTSDTGILTSLHYPAVNVSGFSYDAEGDPLGYQDSIVNVGTTTQSFTYTSRREQEMDSRSPVPAGTSPNANFANGVTVAGTYSQNELSWNATAGTATGWDNPSNSTTGNATAFSYDTAGRQTSRDDTIYDSYGNPHDYVSTRQYDAENRIVSGLQQQHGVGITGTYNTLTAYQWGPNGHPILTGSTPRVSNATPSTSQLAYDTLHWNGGRLLFTTNSQGQVDDIKLGAVGDITPIDAGYSGLTFWDRIAGSAAFCHNATGAAGTDASSATHTTTGCARSSGQTMQQPASIVWSGSTGLAGGVGQGHVLGMPGSDGLADGVGILQGVRLYDPQLGGWTTPDAYQGRLDSPITEKSYIWNNDNAVAFSDPSGNDPAGESFWGTVGGVAGFIIGAVAVAALVALVIVAAPEILAAVGIGAAAALEATEITVAASDVVEGLDTIVGFDVPIFRIPFVKIPAIAQTFAKVGGAIGAAIGQHLGEDYAKSKDTAPMHDSFIFTYIWGDFETMDHQVLQYFYKERVHNAENYGFHHGVLHDPSEGLNGSYDTMQGALNGGPGMLNYCWSCDKSGGNPFPL